MNLLEQSRDQIVQMERICISEAQQTAHLLHNISDERSLVHDFPWWQMIPCLICASSILLVAGAFFDRNQTVSALQPETFDEDAETCLKVFEALSLNSEAAQKATEMLKGLKKLRTWSKCKIETLQSSYC